MTFCRHISHLLKTPHVKFHIVDLSTWPDILRTWLEAKMGRIRGGGPLCISWRMRPAWTETFPDTMLSTIIAQIRSLSSERHLWVWNISPITRNLRGRPLSWHNSTPSRFFIHTVKRQTKLYTKVMHRLLWSPSTPYWGWPSVLPRSRRYRLRLCFR